MPMGRRFGRILEVVMATLHNAIEGWRQSLEQHNWDGFRRLRRDIYAASNYLGTPNASNYRYFHVPSKSGTSSDLLLRPPV